ENASPQPLVMTSLDASSLPGPFRRQNEEQRMFRCRMTFHAGTSKRQGLTAFVPSASGGRLGLLQKQLGDGLQLHVAGSLVNRANLGIPVVLLGGIFLRIAVSAEQLQALRRDSVRHLGTEELGHRRLAQERLTTVLQAS